MKLDFNDIRQDSSTSKFRFCVYVSYSTSSDQYYIGKGITDEVLRFNYIGSSKSKSFKEFAKLQDIKSEILATSNSEFEMYMLEYRLVDKYKNQLINTFRGGYAYMKWDEFTTEDEFNDIRQKCISGRNATVKNNPDIEVRRKAKIRSVVNEEHRKLAKSNSLRKYYRENPDKVREKATKSHNTKLANDVYRKASKLAWSNRTYIELENYSDIHEVARTLNQYVSYCMTYHRKPENLTSLGIRTNKIMKKCELSNYLNNIDVFKFYLANYLYSKTEDSNITKRFKYAIYNNDTYTEILSVIFPSSDINYICKHATEIQDDIRIKISKGIRIASRNTGINTYYKYFTKLSWISKSLNLYNL